MARPVAVTALACAAVFAAAGLGSLLLLAGGSSAVQSDVGARVSYVAEHNQAWRAGWLLWAAAGLAVLLFYTRVASDDAAGRAALAFATVGLAVRLSAEAAVALMLPLDNAMQLAVERWALVADAFVGHGLETLAGITIVWGAWSNGRLPHWLVLTSLPLWLSGGVLCGAVIAGSGAAVLAATVALVVSATAWYTLVGVTAWKAV